ncbi:unnamed protein product, partial [Hapterophycus canaliculatus]
LFLQPRITFGSGGDIKPLSLTVAKDHCAVLREGAAAPAVAEGEEDVASDAPPPTFTLECGEGETFINGRLMSKSEQVAMSCYDRVAIGGELLLFDHPGARPPSVSPGEGGNGESVAPLPPTAEFAVEELQAALRNKGKQAQEVRRL